MSKTKKDGSRECPTGIIGDSRQWARCKCRCVYRRTEEGVCLPSCGFNDKPLTPEEHEIEVIKEHVDDVELLIISKKTP